MTSGNGTVSFEVTLGGHAISITVQSNRLPISSFELLLESPNSLALAEHFCKTHAVAWPGPTHNPGEFFDMPAKELRVDDVRTSQDQVGGLAKGGTVRKRLGQSRGAATRLEAAMDSVFGQSLEMEEVELMDEFATESPHERAPNGSTKLSNAGATTSAAIIQALRKEIKKKAMPDVAIVLVAQKLAGSVLKNGSTKTNIEFRKLLSWMCVRVAFPSKRKVRWSESLENLTKTVAWKIWWLDYARAICVRLLQDYPSDWTNWRRAQELVFATPPEALKIESMVDFLWYGTCTEAFSQLDEKSSLPREEELASFVGRSILYIAKEGLKRILENPIEQQTIVTFEQVMEFPLRVKFSARPRFGDDDEDDDNENENEEDDGHEMLSGHRDLEYDLRNYLPPPRTLEEAFLCVICNEPLMASNPPITFGDGLTTCRGCAEKKRMQMQLMEAMDQRNNETGGGGAVDFLSASSGKANDVTVSKAIRLAGVPNSVSNTEVDAKRAAASSALRKIGNQFYENGQYPQAAQAYTQAIEVGGGTPVLFSNRSAAYARLGDFNLARAEALSALKISNGRWGKAYYRIYESCAVMEPSMLRRDFRRVRLRRNPQFQDEHDEYSETEDEFLNRKRTKRFVGARWLENVKAAVEATACLVRSVLLGERSCLTMARVLRAMKNHDVHVVKNFYLQHKNTLQLDGSALRSATQTDLLLPALLHELVTCTQLRIMLGQNQSLESTVKLDKSALELNHSEFDCTLCYSLLCKPTTLPCGHSFCMSCAIRAIDHGLNNDNPKCPVCRFDLTEYMQSLDSLAVDRASRLTVLDIGFQHIVVNRALNCLLLNVFPDESQSRLLDVCNEERAAVLGSGERPLLPNERLTCLLEYDQPLVPGCRDSSTVFEPALRLMIRRLAFPDQGENQNTTTAAPSLVVCWGTDEETYKYGILASIDHLIPEVEESGLGLDLYGMQRVRVLNTMDRDGYKIARVELLEEDIHQHHIREAALLQYLNEHYPIKKNFDEDLNKWENARWANAPKEIIQEAMRRLWAKIKETNKKWFSMVGEHPCCDSSLPYVASLVLKFSSNMVYFLMFSRVTLFDYFERCKFVLRFADPTGKPKFSYHVDFLTCSDFYPNLARTDCTPDEMLL